MTKAREILSSITTSLRTFLFPERCVICDELSLSVCNNCIRLLDKAKCPGSKRILPNGDSAEYIYDYRDKNVQKLLFALKDRYVFTVYEFALGEIEESFSRYIDEGYSLCHIPRSIINRKKHGVDQSQMLTSLYLRETNKGEARKYTGFLRRHMFSEVQKNLSVEERMKNAERAFFVNGKVPEKILLFDDIVTTGATACAAANVLYNAGAKDIKYLFIAST